jgi:hypothetical protein
MDREMEKKGTALPMKTTSRLKWLWRLFADACQYKGVQQQRVTKGHRAILVVKTVRDMSVDVVVPQWNPRTVISVPASQLPEGMIARLSDRSLMIAKANLDAVNPDDLLLVNPDDLLLESFELIPEQ